MTAASTLSDPPEKDANAHPRRKRKFLSVCSGIEAVSVAWDPLDFEPVAYSEIELFPSAVLAQRYPDIPNLGDMTQYANWKIPSIDILAGGTPCQSFSVAGKRGSLNDKRGNLSLTFCAIADKFDPEWVLWENVPGVLNTVDNAFGCLLGKLCGAGDAILPAQGRKHAHCGVVAGPKRTVAWRTLDAQWFGLPQRRRRLFVLAGRGPGNWASADALLPFGDSLPGYFTPGGKAREKTPPGAGARSEGSHWDGGTHPTLGAISTGVGMSDQELFAQRGAYLVRNISPAVTSKWAKGSGGPAGDECQNLVISLETRCPEAEKSSVTSYGMYENQRAEMRLYKGLQPTLTCGGGKAGQGSNMVFISFQEKGDGDGCSLYENHAQDSRVSGLLPISPTCAAKWGTGGGNTPLVLYRDGSKRPLAETRSRAPDSTLQLCFPVDMRTLLRSDSSPSAGSGLGEDGAPSYTLTAQGHVPGVAYVIQGEMADGRRLAQNGLGIAENTSYTLTASAVHCISAHGFVRRLMPVECERLQGFPDDWTKIEKKPGSGCPDGPRYKAVGNSMAVLVIRWIGQQIIKTSIHA